MELNQITYFVALARLLHFTRAAEACNVSQPALTKAIQRLEEELGGPLFHRERANTQLTELGAQLRPVLERALTSVNDAKAQAAAFRRRETSPLHVGVELSLPTTLLAPVLTTLARQTADFELSLHQGSQADLYERMVDGELDVSLLVEESNLPERLHRWTMFAEGHVLICPPGHRLGDLATVVLADLAQERVLLHEDAACPIRRHVASAFARAGIKPAQYAFASSQEQILDLVRASVGVAVAGENQSRLSHLPTRPFAAAPDMRQVALTVVAGRPMGPTAALFMKLMRARAWSLQAADGTPNSAAA